MISLCLVAIIRVYQATLSSVFGNRCRFYPSCSEYSVTAIERFGTVQGLILTVKRLSKCHPFHPGGIDPVGDK